MTGAFAELDESMFAQELAGYGEYPQRVRYRLLRYVW